MAKKTRWAGIALLCAALSGCNSDDGATAVPSPELLGKWLFTKAELFQQETATKNGVVVSDEKFDTTMDVTGKGYYLELKASSKFEANFPVIFDRSAEKVSAVSGLQTGSWSVSGNTLALIDGTDFFADTVLVSVSITGASGVFTLNNIHELTEDSTKTTYTDISTLTATKQ